MLYESDKVRIKGYGQIIRVGPRLVRGGDTERFVAVRTILNEKMPPPFRKAEHEYQADQATVSRVDNLMPSWKLLYSVNPFPSGTSADRMKTGKNLASREIPIDEVRVRTH